MFRRMLSVRHFSSAKNKVAVIGSGNWGSVAARIVAQNVKILPNYDPEVKVWVFEEDYKGGKLTDHINTTHENTKYLPGVNLGENIRADPDLLSAVSGANMLVFVTPHQFINGLCDTLQGNVSKDTHAISLIKGMDVTPDGFQLISGVINQQLGLDTSVLMGANIASEIAKEEFSEATVGYSDVEAGKRWQALFHTPYFHVRAVEDVAGVELCGTLKNIVALGAGFVDGLGLGNNTKAAVIRIGLQEMRLLAKIVFPSVQNETFFESAGVADLITTCFGGRNRKCAEAFVQAQGTKTFDQIEAELLGGQKLQGVLTSHEVQVILEKRGLLDQFPLFNTIHRITTGELKPDDIVRYADL